MQQYYYRNGKGIIIKHDIALVVVCNQLQKYFGKIYRLILHLRMRYYQKSLPERQSGIDFEK
jgi:hypothetical protein